MIGQEHITVAKRDPPKTNPSSQKGSAEGQSANHKGQRVRPCYRIILFGSAHLAGCSAGAYERGRSVSVEGVGR